MAYFVLLMRHFVYIYGLSLSKKKFQNFIKIKCNLLSISNVQCPAVRTWWCVIRDPPHWCFQTLLLSQKPMVAIQGHRLSIVDAYSHLKVGKKAMHFGKKNAVVKSYNCNFLFWHTFTYFFRFCHTFSGFDTLSHTLSGFCSLSHPL